VALEGQGDRPRDSCRATRCYFHGCTRTSIGYFIPRLASHASGLINALETMLNRKRTLCAGIIDLKVSSGASKARRRIAAYQTANNIRTRRAGHIDEIIPTIAS
jgi:hypothetical protein